MIFSLVLSLDFDLKKKNKLNPKKRHVEESNGSLKFEITAKRLYAASQRVL